MMILMTPSPYSMVRQLLENEKTLINFCLNCQGLKAHWDAFCNFTDEMNNKNCTGSFDVIDIAELFHISKGEYNFE